AFAAILTRIAVATVLAFAAIIPFAAAFARLFTLAGLVALTLVEVGIVVRVEILDAADFALAILAIGLAAVALFLAGAEIAVHAEIMVGELQIIFGLHPVTRKLGVAGEILEFLDHLHRVTAGPAVDAVRLIDPTTTAARLRAMIVIVVI